MPACTNLFPWICTTVVPANLTIVEIVSPIVTTTRYGRLRIVPRLRIEYVLRLAPLWHNGPVSC